MIDRNLGLRIVDGLDLEPGTRAALRPGALVSDAHGRRRRLPRYFYVVDSPRRAQETIVAEHFTMNELVNVDVREARVLLEWPRYVPCAVTLLAAHLELLRMKVGAPVHLAANGGYRSPVHQRAPFATPHSWGTAADIFMIGTERLDDRERIERYAALASAILPGARVSAYGRRAGESDDHLHLDLGYVVHVPHTAPGEEEDQA